MIIRPVIPSRGRAGAGILALLLLISGTALTRGAHAVGIERGDLHGSIDTTLSMGASWRVQERDSDLVCRANGGTAFGCNADDGNLNYDRGIVSLGPKFTTELDLEYQNFGFFGRAIGFLDFENENGSRERTPLGKATKDLVGSDVDVLDAYGWGRFDIAHMSGELRLGKQVLSWGESTFIQNGINTINPFDVSKLRVPGAELRDALVPVPMVSGNLAISEMFSMEAFYQLDWDKTTIDPNGTFFSTTDIAGTDATKVMLGFGDISDLGDINPGLGPPLGGGAFDSKFLSVRRGPDINPRDGGQFGVALRMFVPKLNDTEFGFYFIRYHSRLPVIDGVTGTTAGVGNATAAAAAGAALAGGAGFAAAVGAGAAAGAASGADDPAGSALKGATAATNAGAAGVSAVATDLYAETASYRLEYPEDINLYGISFNTQLGTTGWALQGEYSFRQDVPLQVDDVELLFAALTPLSGLNPAVAVNQIGSFGTSTLIPGYITRNVSQLQATATRVFGQAFGANQVLFVAEAAVNHVHDMPDKDVLRLEGPGTFTSGNPFHAGATGLHAGKPAESSSHFADATSWGYRIATRFDYLNAIGAVNLSPRIQWQHDVSGVSPGPGGSFLEGRKAISVGLTASYLEQWEFDVSYTSFFGADRHNLLNDRDFVSASLKYLF